MISRRKPVTLLTGGTGFLGSHIGARLLRNGEEITFLARGNRTMSAAERLQSILDWHSVPRPRRAQVRLLEGNLEKPILGIDRVIHCASDTSFSERNRERVWATNVDLLQDLMDFVIRSRIPSFVYVSTAFVAGRRSGYCPEEPVENSRFYNVYEESKAAAETFLLRICREKKVHLTILRPSIVYGDSRTGRTFRFNALYYPVRTALILQKIFIEDIRERGGARAAEVGVALEPDGTTVLPLRVEVQKHGGVNLIPIDFFIDAFFALLQNSEEGGIFHIVNPRQTRIEDIILYAQNQFKLRGIRASGPQEFRAKPRNSMELLFQRYLEAYSPYIKDMRIFTTEKASPILERHKVRCPEFDESMFRLCMFYAVEHGWAPLSI